MVCDHNNKMRSSKTTSKDTTQDPGQKLTEGWEW